MWKVPLILLGNIRHFSASILGVSPKYQLEGGRIKKTVREEGDKIVEDMAKY